MLEFVLAFPLILALMLGCIQFAHIWMGRQVVNYAAFCAARAALVSEKSEYRDAAQQAAASFPPQLTPTNARDRAPVCSSTNRMALRTSPIA